MCRIGDTGRLIQFTWNCEFLKNISNVFLRFLKGCRGGALGCQHHFPFYV